MLRNSKRRDTCNKLGLILVSFTYNARLIYRPPSLSRNQGELRNHIKFFEVRDKQISTLSQFRGMSGSCFVFHNVYTIDSDFKRIFADLIMMSKRFTIPVMKGCV